MKKPLPSIYNHSFAIAFSVAGCKTPDGSDLNGIDLMNSPTAKP